jgi:hypothetical protein
MRKRLKPATLPISSPPQLEVKKAAEVKCTADLLPARRSISPTLKLGDQICEMVLGMPQGV